MKILGFGDIFVDKIITIDRFPKKGEKAKIISSEEYASGKCANVIAALSKLDFRSSFIGKVGSDAEGSLLIENMINHGVDTKDIVLGNGNSGIRIILRSEDKNSKIFLENMGENYNIKLEEIAGLENADIAYFVLLKDVSLKTQRNIAKIMKEQGAKIIINTESLDKESEEIIKLADVVFLDYNEFSNYSLDEIENNIKRILKSASFFVVKIQNGVNGSIVFENRSKIEKHLFRNRIEKNLNSLYVSSAFDSGFIFGFSKDKSLEECIKMANIFIRECIKSKDPLSGIPNIQRLNSLLGEVD